LRDVLRRAGIRAASDLIPVCGKHQDALIGTLGRSVKSERGRLENALEVLVASGTTTTDHTAHSARPLPSAPSRARRHPLSKQNRVCGFAGADVTGPRLSVMELIYG
jgi:hypothetical protein